MHGSAVNYHSGTLHHSITECYSGTTCDLGQMTVATAAAAISSHKMTFPTNNPANVFDVNHSNTLLTSNGKRRGRKPGLNSTMAQRSAANSRERSRMRVLSSAFVELKGALPWVPGDTKLSKLDTLKLASGYISYLRNILKASADLDETPNDSIDTTATTAISMTTTTNAQKSLHLFNLVSRSSRTSMGQTDDVIFPSQMTQQRINNPSDTADENTFRNDRFMDTPISGVGSSMISRPLLTVGSDCPMVFTNEEAPRFFDSEVGFKRNPHPVVLNGRVRPEYSTIHDQCSWVNFTFREDMDTPNGITHAISPVYPPIHPDTNDLSFHEQLAIRTTMLNEEQQQISRFNPGLSRLRSPTSVKLRCNSDGMDICPSSSDDCGSDPSRFVPIILPNQLIQNPTSVEVSYDRLSCTIGANYGGSFFTRA